GAAVADLGEIVLGLAIVSEQRAEPDVDHDRDTNDGQRDQKELNGQGGGCCKWAASRAFALDEFVHAIWKSAGCQKMPESGQFYHANRLASREGDGCGAAPPPLAREPYVAGRGGRDRRRTKV